MARPDDPTLSGRLSVGQFDPAVARQPCGQSLWTGYGAQRMDFSGDGRLDLVVGQALTGQASKARVYDALTLNEMFASENRFSYGGGYTGGLFVAALAKRGNISPV